METKIILLAAFLQSDKDWTKCYETISRKIPLENTYIELAEREKDKYCTLLDETYPERLKQVYRPPFAFEFKNDISTLANDYVYLVGDTNKALDKHNYCKIKVLPNRTYKIIFSNSDVYIKTHTYEDAVKIVSAYSRAAVLDNSVSTGRVHMIISYFENTSIFVKPTLKPSKANNLIKSGATLYDCEDDLNDY